MYTPSSSQTRDPDQPTLDDLSSLGVKVRDFAYESTLPPVQPYRRYPRQDQPESGSLKRSREDAHQTSEEQNDAGPSDLLKKAKLGRTSTEPTVERGHHVRRGQYHPTSFLLQQAQSIAPQSQSQESQLSFSSLFPDSQSQNPESQFESQTGPPPSLQSQGSDTWLATPLVTPNGSLQWLKARNETDVHRDEGNGNDVPPSPSPQPSPPSIAADRITPRSQSPAQSASLTPQTPPPDPPTTPTPRYNFRSRPPLPPPPIATSQRPISKAKSSRAPPSSPTKRRSRARLGKDQQVMP